jgi:GH25 family lysozyme M1 (1,4-beta-N-acetylmuramidase)
LVFVIVPALVMTFGLVRVLAQRPLGTDVSSYQSASLNWASLKSNGIVFAWAKATEGLTVNDSDYTTFQANAKAAEAQLVTRDEKILDNYSRAVW